MISKLLRNLLVAAAVCGLVAQPVLAQPVPGPSGSATAANQTTLNTAVGTTGQSAAASDTATASLIQLTKRNNQNLTTLDGRVDGIEGLLTTQAAYLDGLEGMFDGVEGLIGTTNTNLGTVNTTIGSTNTLLTTQNGYLDGLEGQIGATNESAAASDSATAGLNGLMKRLLASITTLNTKTTDIQTAANDTNPATVTGTVTLGAATADVGNFGVAQASTTSAQKGPLVQGAVTTSAPSYTTAQTSPLSLTTGGALRTSDATKIAQGSTTSGQTGDLILGAVTTAAPSYTTAQSSPLSLTTAGALRVDNSANTQPISGSTKLLDTGGSTAGTVKAASTQAATTDTALVVAQSPNPNTLCDSSVAISQTASTDILTSTAKIHICSIILVSDTAQFINVIEGTGTVCATGGAALIGSTTAGSGLSVAANGGFSAVSDRAWLKSKTTADHICVTQSGSGRLSGVITYKDAS